MLIQFVSFDLYFCFEQILRYILTYARTFGTHNIGQNMYLSGTHGEYLTSLLLEKVRNYFVGGLGSNFLQLVAYTFFS